jgi:hypothetical protein
VLDIISREYDGAAQFGGDGATLLLDEKRHYLLPIYVDCGEFRIQARTRKHAFRGDDNTSSESLLASRLLSRIMDADVSLDPAGSARHGRAWGFSLPELVAAVDDHDVVRVIDALTYRDGERSSTTSNDARNFRLPRSSNGLTSWTSSIPPRSMWLATADRQSIARRGSDWRCSTGSPTKTRHEEPPVEIPPIERVAAGSGPG